ncbi:MAG: hypothetical protein AB7E55_19815 [Pigmentiphaga sp.]
MSIERTGDARILAGTPAVVSVQFYQAGVEADPGTVSVVIARADGSVMTPVASVAGEGTDPRTLALSADETTEIDLLTLRWTSEELGTVVTRAEIVGDRLFTLAQARAFDNGALANTTTYPDAAIEEARTRIEDAFAAICEVSFIPRFEVEVLSGSAQAALLLNRFRIQAVRFVEIREANTNTWTALTESEREWLELESWGGLWRRPTGWPSGYRNIRVGYVHGHDPMPPEIRRAGLILARYELVSSNLSDRATSFSDESGTYRMATAGLTRGSWFGLPLVDSVLQRHIDRVPRVG